MKYLSVLILTAVMLLQPTSSVCAESEGLLPTDEEEFLAHLVENYTIGDVDKSYSVTLKDAASVLKYALNLKQPDTVYQKFVSDSDGDGDVSLGDASDVLRTALNLKDAKHISSISKDRGNAKAFIRETDKEDKNRMSILTSKEQLENYLDVYSETRAAEVLEKYGDIFGDKNFLAVNVRVYTDSMSAVRCYTVINGRHIMVQMVENEISNNGKIYEFVMFTCMDKGMTEDTAELSLDDREVTNKTDVIAVLGSGEETVDYTEATEYGHLIRNTGELQAYRNFLNESCHMEDGSLDEYTNTMNREHFYTNSYAVFTWCRPSGTFSYEVTGMRLDERVLKVQLKYIDKNEAGIPGEKDGLNCVFVKVPVLVADHADRVELEIISP